MPAPLGTPRSPVARHVAFGLASLVLFAVGTAHACLWMFSNFQIYDDEGYFIVLVRHLLQGHRIYDDVSTVYGPAWLFYRWILNGVLGAPLTTDGVRVPTLCAWIACAVIAGVLVRRATRGQPLSRWIALGTFGFALLHLYVFANEPGHPQDFALLLFLGGLTLFLGLRERRPLVAALLLGLALAGLCWTKVNLGVFFALPLALLLLARDARRASRAAGWLVLAVTLALPWMLMSAHLAQPWAIGLASVADGGLLAAWAFLHAEPVSDRRREILGLVAGLAAGTLVCVGFALARGSTLPGMWRALVVLPSRFTTEIVLEIRVPGAAAVVAPLALLLALFARARAARLPHWVLPAAELAFGVFALWNIAPHPEWMIPYVLPCAWIVLVPQETRAARLPLLLCAPLQALQVFPVSGSQEALGTILLVPIAAIAVGDACAALWRAGAFARTWRVLAGLVVVLFLLHITVVLTSSVRGLASYWDDMEERVALPGTRWTRIEESTAGRARFLADTLRGSFRAFLSVRGDNSLYSWTGIVPSTGVIVSHSWRLFDERQQAELAAAYENTPDALLLDNRERITGELRAQFPFFRMLERDYRPVARIGADELCVRRTASPPRFSSCVLLPESSIQLAGARLELRWPAGVQGTEVARVQVANLAQHYLFADSAHPDPRVHPRIFDGGELLFDGGTRARIAVERLAQARDLRLELPGPLPPDQASFCCLRLFGPDDRRVLSLPVVVTGLETH